MHAERVRVLSSPDTKNREAQLHNTMLRVVEPFSVPGYIWVLAGLLWGGRTGPGIEIVGKQKLPYT